MCNANVFIMLHWQLVSRSKLFSWFSHANVLLVSPMEKRIIILRSRLYIGIYAYVYTSYIYIWYILCNINGGDKGHMNLKENGEEFMGGFGGKKGKGECN